MNDREKLTQQMSDIGNRYLKRTLGELERLQELLGQARTGDAESVREIERITHKINGSGAMFGFDSVSERAHQMEILAESGFTDAQTLQGLDSCLAALTTEVQIAARSRGVE